MRSICLYFQVHQPFRLKTYRFFSIGEDHQYFDEYLNRSVIRRVSDNCYLPANKLMLDLIHEYGSIEFTSDMFAPPLTSGNKFRFVAIPGTIPALKSGTPGYMSEQELKSMSYQEICRLYNIPE